MNGVLFLLLPRLESRLQPAEMLSMQVRVLPPKGGTPNLKETVLAQVESLVRPPHSP